MEKGKNNTISLRMIGIGTDCSEPRVTTDPKMEQSTFGEVRVRALS